MTTNESCDIKIENCQEDRLPSIVDVNQKIIDLEQEVINYKE